MTSGASVGPVAAISSVSAVRAIAAWLTLTAVPAENLLVFAPASAASPATGSAATTSAAVASAAAVAAVAARCVQNKNAVRAERARPLVAALHHERVRRAADLDRDVARRRGVRCIGARRAVPAVPDTAPARLDARRGRVSAASTGIAVAPVLAWPRGALAGAAVDAVAPALAISAAFADFAGYSRGRIRPHLSAGLYKGKKCEKRLIHLDNMQFRVCRTSQSRNRGYSAARETGR